MSSEVSKNLVGTYLDERYRLDTLLGQGSMGEVYRARDTLLQRDVAIKVLSHHSLGTSGRTRLLHEAQYIANLNHPNIVTVYDVGDRNGLPFIVMEFVDGRTLHDSMPTDLDTILSISCDICTALQHAHAHGIIHRDLKPENVLLQRIGGVKLMDFGIAVSTASRLTEEGMLLGTVFYISPEQALGREIDQRADLYSLGVLLYEMVCGRLPFEAEDPLAVITQHLHAPVVPPRARNEAIPADLDKLIVRLLAKSPEDRPESASEVFSVLENIKTKPASEAAMVPSQEGDEISTLERIASGRLVGRSAELDKARSMWRDAVAGHGQLLLISGEPGIGKTRMVQELSTQTQISGGLSLIGRSYAEWDPPYAPFRQILRDAVRITNGFRSELPEDVLIDLVKIAPELRAEFPNLPQRSPEDPQTEGQRLLDQILLFFSLLANHATVLLVLEDAHWSDHSTLSLLRHLVRNTRAERLMILVTYREVELDEARALHEILLDFNREKLGLRIKLNRLNRQETKDMLTFLFAEEITPEFLDGIYRETDGNPFFIEEVCKALVKSGKLTFQDGRWKRPSMEEMGIPQSIQVAIQARLRALPEVAQKTLEQAAILGREFDFETLAHAITIDEDSLLDALDEAMYARLLEAKGKDKDGQFAFVHALIPATITTGLRTLRRRGLHKRAASALEFVHPEFYEALAHHYIEAGRMDEAVEYLIKAGDRARDLFAHQEAIECYHQALDYLKEERNEAQAANTLMKLGLTYLNEFRFPDARQSYEEAFTLWQQAGKPDEGESLPPAPHAFRYLMQEPSSLDPISNDGYAAHIIDNIFSGLVELTSDWEVVPDVAQRWEVLDNGRRYVFYLREDVTWSDGVLVTAHDFEYAWKRALDTASGTAEPVALFAIKNAKAYFKGDIKDPNVVGVHVRDDFTLEIELEVPSNAFLYILSQSNSFPVPRHVLQKHGANWTDLEVLVTNGPFKIATWEAGKAILVEADPNYKRRFPGNLQQVEMLFFTRQKSNLGMSLYQEDRIDIVWIGYSDNPKRIRSQYFEEYRTAPFLRTDYIGFNTIRPPFDDPRVRKAFVLATNREYLINTIYEGIGGIPATGGLLPPGMPGHAEGIALPYDPSQARRLLAEAGYPGSRGFPVVEAYKPSNRKFRDLIQTHWQENLGVEIRWIAIPWEEFTELQDHHNLHLWTMGEFAEYPDPDLLLGGSILGRTGWSYDEYDFLLNRAAEMMDYAQRLKLYLRAELILVEEVPVLPISYASFNLLVKPWVRRFPISPTKSWYWKEIILEPH